MLNSIVTVGRLTQDLEIKELENGTKVAYITLAVPRPLKNAEGVYETDFIPVTLLGGVAENTLKYCKKGDLMAVRGRMQTKTIEIEKGKKIEIEIIAEKVTFLSSSKSEE